METINLTERHSRGRWRESIMVVNDINGSPTVAFGDDGQENV